MAGLFAAFPVNCADPTSVHTAQTKKIRDATETNRVIREAPSILATLIVILSFLAAANSSGGRFLKGAYSATTVANANEKERQRA